MTKRTDRMTRMTSIRACFRRLTELIWKTAAVPACVALQVANRVDARLEQIKETLPENLELVKIYDQSKFIASAINDVKSAALLGGVLAIIVLYGFLRDSRATTIIAVAIPVSVIGTFLLMYANDVSLNIMSLGGIALAVGMLVDNAIVVLENIVRKREAGEGVLEAARNGTAEVSTAVIAATLTTIAVFFPMVFISGIAGELFRDQALTVTFALTISLIVALTLIPMLAAPTQCRSPGSVLELTRSASLMSGQSSPVL